jgi:hypothetical protein
VDGQKTVNQIAAGRGSPQAYLFPWHMKPFDEMNASAFFQDVPNEISSPAGAWRRA